MLQLRCSSEEQTFQSFLKKNIFIGVVNTHKKTFYNMIQVLLLAAVASYILPTEGHVALTFPPARKYDLDFLDTARSVEQVFRISAKFLSFLTVYSQFLNPTATHKTLFTFLMLI